MIENVIMNDAGYVCDFSEMICGKATSLAHRFPVARLEHAAVNERFVHSAFTLASWATTLSLIKWP